MKGDLFIKTDGEWVDAYEQWRISLEDGAISALLSPAPLKELVSNKSRLEHGKEFVSKQYVRQDERDIQLELHFTARTKAAFFSQYKAFCDEVLYQGTFALKTRYADDVYHLVYLSTANFTSFMFSIGKITIRCNEPNTAHRTDD